MRNCKQCGQSLAIPGSICGCEYTRFHGDLARFTGNIEQIYGGTFHEVRLMEGHLKGKTRLVTRKDR